MKKSEKIMNFLMNENVLEFMYEANRGRDVSSDLLANVVSNLIDVILVDNLSMEQRAIYDKETSNYYLCNCDDKERNRLEISIINKLLNKLRFINKDIVSLEDYKKLFKEEITSYKESFLLDTYIKLLPENICRYFGCRIDTSIPWSEMYYYPENEGINIISLVESGYLDYRKSMSDFMVGDTDC